MPCGSGLQRHGRTRFRQSPGSTIRANAPGFNSFVGHATTAFADEIMTRIYIDEIFGPEFPGDPSNDEVVAEWLAFARHRMLFGMDPDPKLLAAPPPPAVR